MAADPFTGERALTVEVYGCDGSYWYISGPDLDHLDAGVSLNPRITGGIDAPVKTLWMPGAFGQEHQGMRWQRRDMVFSVNTFAQDHETWLTVDSDWRYAFDYVEETIIVFTTSQGARYLSVRMLEEPKSYEGDTDRGKSPFLVCDSTVVMTVAAELPFYWAEPLVYEFETTGSSRNWSVAISCDSDVPVFPRWTLTAPGTWTLPDFSWGSEEYGRGMQDSGRTVRLPTLLSGEHLVADADPRKQTLLASNRALVQGRWKGNDLLYPIAPGTEALIPVSVTGATGGAAFRLEVPRWYTRPWSRRR